MEMMIPALLLYASLVNDVRSMLDRRDFASAERAVRTYEAQAGGTSEAAAALSWLARGELEARDYGRAETYAAEARKLTDELLRTRKLDTDPWLSVALGASIEVHAQALAAQGQRSEAVLFLRQQLKLLGPGPVAERTHKNLNLLSLEGKPAPGLQAADFIGAQPPPLASLHGHPVLLFFWAHWCPDCKAEAPILADLIRTYAPKGLRLVAPSKLYGFGPAGEPAGPADEKRYAAAVWQQFYGALGSAPVPFDAANFQTYGASTTPTIALIDATGIVRYYHPGAVSRAELDARIRQVLPR